MRRVWVSRMMVAIAVATTVTVHADTSPTLRARGIDLGFNLDYPEALEAFRAAVAADPSDAAAYRMAAASLWVSLLFEQGAITVEDYLGRARASVIRKPPSPELAAAFREYVARASTLAEENLRRHPRDADAHFQVGAAAAFQASYIATIEGRVVGSLGAARRAFAAHTRAMELDPGRKDAGLVVGMYRYAVSGLPAPLRVMARVAGFSGGREEGIRLVEEAARYPSAAQTNARFSLILIYNREGRHTDALHLLRALQAVYPRNRLLWLEAGSTALRAGRPGDALAAIDEGLSKAAADRRPRAFGEAARWAYLRGAALVALRRTDAAGQQLRDALAIEAHGWIRGRTHLELGKLADLQGDRPRALERYRSAADLCRPDRDDACIREAKSLSRRAFR